jgi:hypothetical protein
MNSKKSVYFPPTTFYIFQLFRSFWESLCRILFGLSLTKRHFKMLEDLLNLLRGRLHLCFFLIFMIFFFLFFLFLKKNYSLINGDTIVTAKLCSAAQTVFLSSEEGSPGLQSRFKRCRGSDWTFFLLSVFGSFPFSRDFLSITLFSLPLFFSFHHFTICKNNWK